MIRQAFRSLRRAPVFTGVIVLLLALGIGANALIFTAVDALLLRPLPVAHPERLARLGVQRSPTHTSYDHPYVYARFLRDHARSFSEVFAAWPLEMAFSSGNRVESINGNAVSGDYFAALGLTSALGRLITAADEQRDAPVAVLSYGFWQQAFGGRGEVLGQTIRLRGSPFTVVGVLPRGFAGLDLDNRPAVWVPMSACKIWNTKPDLTHVPSRIFVRLRAGVPAVEAAGEIRQLYPAMLAADYATLPGISPDTIQREQSLRPVLSSVERGASTLRKQFTGAISAVMGGVLALLLLICANVGGLMLARSEARSRELGIRFSLGASRWIILRSTLIEAFLLSCAGALAGLAIARWCGPWLMHFLPARRPLGIDLVPDLRVLGFASAVCILSAVLSAVLPARNVFRADLNGLLGRRTGRVSATRVSRALVAFQVALATLLITGSLALLRTLEAIRNQNPGFRRDHLIVLTVNPRMAGVKTDRLPALFGEVVRRAQSLPGVEGVSLAERALLRGVGFKGNAGLEGTRVTFANSLNISINNVSLDHLANIGLRVSRGRAFRAGDEQAKPRPVIVSESFARLFFPGRDPIGQKFGTGSIGTVIHADYEIAGVVNDARYRTMREVPPPTVYFLLDQDALRYADQMVLHVSVRGDSVSAITELKQMLSGAGPGLAPTDIATMEQEIGTSLWQERLLAALSSIFGVLSAVVAALGLFGMLAYAVSRRTREIGIRVAVGATVARIAALVVRDAAQAVLPGIALGLAVYAACSRAIGSLLYGITRWDPATLAVAALCIVFASFLAILVPGLRAARINPVQALREE